MNDQVDRLLEQLKDVSPPGGIQDRVLSSVRREARKRQAKNGFLYISLVFTLPLMFFSLRLFLTDISTSPLGQLLALGVTDWRQVMTFFNTWLMALFESVPVVSLALTIGTFFIMTILATRVVRLIKVQNRHVNGVA